MEKTEEFRKTKKYLIQSIQRWNCFVFIRTSKSCKGKFILNLKLLKRLYLNFLTKLTQISVVIHILIEMFWPISCIVYSHPNAGSWGIKFKVILFLDLNAPSRQFFMIWAKICYTILYTFVRLKYFSTQPVTLVWSE